MLLFRLNILGEGLVVVFAIAQLAVDEAYQHDVATKAECFVGGTEDGLMEDISDAVLFDPQT